MFRTTPVPIRYEYSEFKERFAVLADQLHTLFCESCVPGGSDDYYTFSGDTQLNGCGSFRGRYFKVQAGVIHVAWRWGWGSFRRTQDMRKPVRMKLSTGWSTYDNLTLPKEN